MKIAQIWSLIRTQNTWKKVWPSYHRNISLNHGFLTDQKRTKILEKSKNSYYMFRFCKKFFLIQIRNSSSRPSKLTSTFSIITESENGQLIFFRRLPITRTINSNNPESFSSSFFGLPNETEPSKQLMTRWASRLITRHAREPAISPKLPRLSS